MELPEQGKIIDGRTGCLEWSAVIYPMKNESVSGDLFFVKNRRDNVLVAAIDGLGHGSEALKASKKAVQSLDSFTDQSLISIINSCHLDLKKTRGVVINLAVFDGWEGTMTWAGVGNVEGVLYRSDEKEYMGRENLIVRGGVVGYRLPLLKASIVSVSPGDTLIFTTDGVNKDYMNNVNMKRTPDKIVDNIASNHIDKSDDALVFVARYVGRDL